MVLAETKQMIRIILLLDSEQPGEIVSPVHPSIVLVLPIGIVLVCMPIGITPQHFPKIVQVPLGVCFFLFILPEHPDVNVKENLAMPECRRPRLDFVYLPAVRLQANEVAGVG